MKIPGSGLGIPGTYSIAD